MLDKEEYIEQAYFFQAFRERLADGGAAQEVLASVGEEILSTTRLPLAVSFLCSEIRAAGLLAPAMARLSHYFTPLQAYIVSRAEAETSRFSMEEALLTLEREARYKSDSATTQGLFVFQFEAIARNRLGYNGGVRAMAQDPFYNDDWRRFYLARPGTPRRS